MLPLIPNSQRPLSGSFPGLCQLPLWVDCASSRKRTADAQPLPDASGRTLRLAGTYAGINDRKIAEGRLRRLAEFDTLTGLPNRALFHDRLQQAMTQANRGKPMALLFLEVDRFKGINDTLGHEAGDKLLKVFAIRMRAAVRESDTVARLAGDEFTIIIEGLRDAADARMLAGKLVETLRQPIELAGQSIEVTASIGVTLCIPRARGRCGAPRGQASRAQWLFPG